KPGIPDELSIGPDSQTAKDIRTGREKPTASEAENRERIRTERIAITRGREVHRILAVRALEDRDRSPDLVAAQEDIRVHGDQIGSAYHRQTIVQRPGLLSSRIALLTLADLLVRIQREGERIALGDDQDLRDRLIHEDDLDELMDTFRILFLPGRDQDADVAIASWHPTILVTDRSCTIRSGHMCVT